MSDSQQTQSPLAAPEAPAPVQVTVQSTSNGLGVTALILGLLALVGAFIPFINYGSGFLALVGLIIGIVALTRKGRPKGTAIAGATTSGLAIILSMVLAAVYTAGFIAAVDSSLPQTVTQDAEAQDPADPAEPEVGTRENPAPIGTVIETTSGGAVEYEIVLGAPTLDANALVAAENPYNEAAPAGFQYALVPVTFTYRGLETGTPWLDVTIEFVSAAGTTHTTSDSFVVEPSPTVMEINDLYPDATGTANVVIAIPSADVASGTWAVSGLFSGDTYFFTAQ